MYQFSGKLKSISIALMVIGVLGIGYGFLKGNSKTLKDAKEAIAHHEAKKAQKAEEAKYDPRAIQKGGVEAVHETEEHEATAHGEEAHADDHHAEHVLGHI